MMQRAALSIVAALIWIAAPAFAGTVGILANSFNVSGATTQKFEHATDVTGGGDIHTDVEWDQSTDTNPSEVAYFHFPYPPDIADGAVYTFTINYETNDTGTTKQHCFGVVLVAEGATSPLQEGTLSGASAYVSAAQSVSGNAFNTQHQTTTSSSSAIINPTGGGACTHATCDGTRVRGYLAMSPANAPGCTNPSTLNTRVQQILIHY